MRETLHQLTLALALPITVGAVWIARGERAEPVVRERATAYRVELAQLPLPTRERLRSPGLPTATSAPRSNPEDEAAPRERRPALPEPSQTGAARLDLPSRGGSAPAVVAAPSPRASFETLDAAPRNVPRVAAAPVAMPVSPLSSRRGDTGAPGVVIAGSVPTATDTPTATQTPTAMAAPAAKPSPPEKPAASNAEPNLFRRARLFAQQDALVSVAARDPRLLGSRAATPVATPVKDLPKVSPIAREPLRSDPAPSPKLVNPDGRAPLVPPGKIEDRARTLSPLPASAEPKLPPVELPLPASQTARNAIAMDFGPDEESLPPQAVLGWGKFRPTSFVVIPEPGSATLLGAALAALGALRRSRRRA